MACVQRVRGEGRRLWERVRGRGRGAGGGGARRLEALEAIQVPHAHLVAHAAPVGRARQHRPAAPSPSSSSSSSHRRTNACTRAR